MIVTLFGYGGELQAGRDRFAMGRYIAGRALKPDLKQHAQAMCGLRLRSERAAFRRRAPYRSPCRVASASAPETAPVSLARGRTSRAQW